MSRVDRIIQAKARMARARSIIVREWAKEDPIASRMSKVARAINALAEMIESGQHAESVQAIWGSTDDGETFAEQARKVAYQFEATVRDAEPAELSPDTSIMRQTTITGEPEETL